MKTCIITLAIILCLALCACAAQPAYMTPYEDGSPVKPVTVSTIKTYSKTTNTTSTSTPTTTTIAVPSGYMICPECDGEKLICDDCNGVGKAPESIIEYFDEDSGVWVKKGDPCLHCEEDPGYRYCGNCNNQLIVPITTKTTSE